MYIPKVYLVDYWYFDKYEEEVLFLFGCGLSYTNFTYRKLRIIGHGVIIEVKNIGKHQGDEIIPYTQVFF